MEEQRQEKMNRIGRRSFLALLGAGLAIRPQAECSPQPWIWPTRKIWPTQEWWQPYSVWEERKIEPDKEIDEALIIPPLPTEFIVEHLGIRFDLSASYADLTKALRRLRLSILAGPDLVADMPIHAICLLGTAGPTPIYPSIVSKPEKPISIALRSFQPLHMSQPLTVAAVLAGSARLTGEEASQAAALWDAVEDPRED